MFGVRLCVLFVMVRCSLLLVMKIVVCMLGLVLGVFDLLFGCNFMIYWLNVLVKFDSGWVMIYMCIFV